MLNKIAQDLKRIAQADVDNGRGMECIGYAHIGQVIDQLYDAYPTTDSSMIDLWVGQAIEDRLVKTTLGDLPGQRQEIVHGVAFIKVTPNYKVGRADLQARSEKIL